MGADSRLVSVTLIRNVFQVVQHMLQVNFELLVAQGFALESVVLLEVLQGRLGQLHRHPAGQSATQRLYLQVTGQVHDF